MHVFFDGDRRPFLLNSQMRWDVEPNAFLVHISVISGKTSSPATWRSYAYQFGDWLSFCERIGVEWRHATEVNLGTFRNILEAEASPHTGRTLKRNTINHKVSVICQFYRFAQRKGWIAAVPFDLETSRMSCVQGRSGAKARLDFQGRNNLRFVDAKEDPQIPSRQEVRRFIKGFRIWRNQLMAETMWLTGMRCAEVCSLRSQSLPESPESIEKESVSIKIMGKGKKQRLILFPTRLLRSINRYVHMERRSLVKAGRRANDHVFVGRGGRPLQTSAMNRVFSTNCKRTSLHIWPHLLRHCYAVERLAYLQEIGVPNPLKILQMELGHAYMSTTERYLHLTERMRSEVISTHNSFVDRLVEG